MGKLRQSVTSWEVISVQECSLGHLSSEFMFLTITQFHLPGFPMGRRKEKGLQWRPREASEPGSWLVQSLFGSEGSSELLD